MNPGTPRPTRRTFLKLAAAAAPLALPRLVRADSPNEKLDLAFIGTANQARFSMRETNGQNFIALADVDRDHLARAEADFPAAAAYTDYREMLDREHKNIDAVVVATPDHHHAPAALAAMNLGKHVYCEKPLAHTIHEVRLMTEAARRNNVATQMGFQIHAGNHYRRMVELIRSGAIGPVREVHIWQGGFYSGPRIPDRNDSVHDSLDWDLWLGPAPHRAYHEKIYHPFTWRGWWDFGGGMLADIACHVLDLAHWALDLEHPETAEAFAAEPDPLRPPRSLRVEYRYPARGDQPPVDFTWYDGGAHVEAGLIERFELPEWRSARSILFVGDGGMILTDYSNHLLLPEERFADFQPPDPRIEPSPGHHAEWLDACRGGEPALCNFDYAGPLTESVLFGSAAHRAGNVKLRFDPETATVAASEAASEAAAEYITKSYRPGWELDRFN